MSESIDVMRDHLVRVLDWEDAHVGLGKAVDGIPPAKRGARAAGFDHSPWELLEHIRIAQEDILDFCVKSDYEHTMKWPDDYWPRDPAPPSEQAWTDSLAAYARSLDAMKRLAREADLTATVPTGKGNQSLSPRHSALRRSRGVSRRPNRRGPPRAGNLAK